MKKDEIIERMIELEKQIDELTAEHHRLDTELKKTEWWKKVQKEMRLENK